MSLSGEHSVLNESGIEVCNTLSKKLRESVHRKMVFNEGELYDSETYEESVWDEIEEYGFSKIDFGAGRIVFEIPDKYMNSNVSCVVKFARPSFIEGSGDGLTQNKFEKQIWENEKNSEISEYLCPIYNTGGNNRYVTMPKCKFVSNDEIYADIQYWLLNFDYDFELKKENIGVMPNGNPVVVDYGIEY